MGHVSLDLCRRAAKVAHGLAVGLFSVKCSATGSVPNKEDEGRSANATMMGRPACLSSHVLWVGKIQPAARLWTRSLAVGRRERTNGDHGNGESHL